MRIRNPAQKYLDYLAIEETAKHQFTMEVKQTITNLLEDKIC